MEEIFDICDENGLPVGGTVTRSNAHTEGVRHRTAHIWVLREENGRTQILMQKRSDDKDSFPGCYDTSSAGHIKAGDEPLSSAVRELEEELGIAAKPEELRFAGLFRNQYEKEFYGKPFKDNEVSFVYIYDRPVDERKLVLQKEEVSAVRWFDLDCVYEEKQKHNPAFCVPVEGLNILRQYLQKR